jgi:hypothetical protein
MREQIDLNRLRRQVSFDRLLARLLREEVSTHGTHWPLMLSPPQNQLAHTLTWHPLMHIKPAGLRCFRLPGKALPRSWRNSRRQR